MYRNAAIAFRDAPVTAASIWSGLTSRGCEMDKAELQVSHTVRVTEWLAAYAKQGCSLSFQTRPAGHGCEIVFGIADWEAFVGIMEPGHVSLPIVGATPS